VKLQKPSPNISDFEEIQEKKKLNEFVKLCGKL
jgi:hypothetical protein